MIDAIVAEVNELQDQENTTLHFVEEQCASRERIENMPERNSRRCADQTHQIARLEKLEAI